MKIAITATAPTLDSNIDPRFGRCAYFLIVDSDTMQLEAIDNANNALGGGAGIQSAQMVAEQDVKTVVTGNCGPNAFSVFAQADIQVVTGVAGKVRDVIEQLKSGKLNSADGPNVQSHFGMNKPG